VWGGNSTGQLGTNNVTTVLTPTQITPTLFYNDITASGGHSGAIDTNQNLYTWGLNTSGQLGINVITNRSSPTQLGSFKWSTVVAVGPVTTGIDFTIAIRNDGTLWSWGGNTNGQLGNTTTISRSSPVQVGSGIWSTLYNNNNNQGSMIAQQSNGSLFVWGINNLGQLGINATTNRSSPVQLSTSFNFANSGAIGSTTGAFFDVTGQLYTAGRGTEGELGDGNIAASQARSTPVQIATYYPSSPIQLSSTSWSQISAGTDLSYSVDTTGTLYAWGLNTSYQTGIGTGQTIVSSPTQIGTTINSATAGSTTGGYIKNV
jgi:alpha-tubulin suppressor-like RCC1 family protein